MTNNSKVPEYVPIATKQEHPTHPGRTCETKAERELRYDAQLIAEQEGISIQQAIQIARQLADQTEKENRKRKSNEAKVKHLKRERRHDQSKRDTIPVVETRGPPLQGGGGPGTGKRR